MLHKRFGRALLAGLAVWMTAGLGPQFSFDGRGSADEPSGLAAAVALEDAVVAAIARSEKSVVSIARVAEKGPGLADVQPDLGLGRPGLGVPQGPQDPDFVPTVVRHRRGDRSAAWC